MESNPKDENKKEGKPQKAVRKSKTMHLPHINKTRRRKRSNTRRNQRTSRRGVKIQYQNIQQTQTQLQAKQKKQKKQKQIKSKLSLEQKIFSKSQRHKQRYSEEDDSDDDSSSDEEIDNKNQSPNTSIISLPKPIIIRIGKKYNSFPVNYYKFKSKQEQKQQQEIKIKSDTSQKLEEEKIANDNKTSNKKKLVRTCSENKMIVKSKKNRLKFNLQIDIVIEGKTMKKSYDKTKKPKNSILRKIPHYKGKKDKNLIKERRYFPPINRHAKAFSMPLKAYYIKYIEGKLIKRNKNKQKEGKAIGGRKGNIKFDLNEEIFTNGGKKEYDKTVRPKISILKVRHNRTKSQATKSQSLPITASKIHNIDGKIIKGRQLSQEKTKEISYKSKIIFNPNIEIWDYSLTLPRNIYDKTKKPTQSILYSSSTKDTQSKQTGKINFKESFEEEEKIDYNQQIQFQSQWKNAINNQDKMILLKVLNSLTNLFLQKFNNLEVSEIFKEGISEDLFSQMINFIAQIIKIFREQKEDLEAILKVFLQFERLPKLEKCNFSGQQQLGNNFEMILNYLKANCLLTEQQSNIISSIVKF